MRVFCYYNLHKRCFSLRALDGPEKGRVVAHASEVHLRQVAFKVSLAGRARVLRDCMKNVHAGAEGLLERMVPNGEVADESWARLHARLTLEGGRTVSYDPYRAAYFYDKETGEPVWSTPEAYFAGRQLQALPALD